MGKFKITYKFCDFTKREHTEIEFCVECKRKDHHTWSPEAPDALENGMKWAAKKFEKLHKLKHELYELIKEHKRVFKYLSAEIGEFSLCKEEIRSECCIVNKNHGKEGAKKELQALGEHICVCKEFSRGKPKESWTEAVDFECRSYHVAFVVETDDEGVKHFEPKCAFVCGRGVEDRESEEFVSQLKASLREKITSPFRGSPKSTEGSIDDMLKSIMTGGKRSTKDEDEDDDDEGNANDPYYAKYQKYKNKYNDLKSKEKRRN